MNVLLLLLCVIVSIQSAFGLGNVTCIMCLDEIEIPLSTSSRGSLAKAYNNQCSEKDQMLSDVCYVSLEFDYYLQHIRISLFGWNLSMTDENQTAHEDNLTIITSIDKVADDVRIRTKLIYTCTTPSSLCNDLLFKYLSETKTLNGLFTSNLYKPEWLDQFFILLIENQFDMYLMCFADEFKKAQPCEENMCSIGRFHDQNHQRCDDGKSAQIDVETMITAANERYEWVSYICNRDYCNSMEAIDKIKEIFQENNHVSKLVWPRTFAVTKPTTTSLPNPFGNQSST
jgi:hypothetical protein